MQVEDQSQFPHGLFPAGCRVLLSHIFFPYQEARQEKLKELMLFRRDCEVSPSSC